MAVDRNRGIREKRTRSKKWTDIKSAQHPAKEETCATETRNAGGRLCY